MKNGIYHIPTVEILDYSDDEFASFSEGMENPSIVRVSLSVNTSYHFCGIRFVKRRALGGFISFLPFRPLVR